MIQTELAQFIALEARLIDEGQYEEWLELFADDGHYWLPISPEQNDPVMQPCLAYEDPLLLSIRVKRLRHPQAHSQQPLSRCQHLLQTSHLIEQTTGDDGRDYWSTRTPFAYYEQRAEQTIHLAGTATHQLIKIDGTLRIKLKRVDLLQGSTALPMIQLFP